MYNMQLTLWTTVFFYMDYTLCVFIIRYDWF